MKKLNITQGKWEFIEQTLLCGWKHLGKSIKQDVSKEELIANEQLIIDAGNTAQKCDLLPSELLEQRDELLGALKEIKKDFEYNIGEKRAETFPSIVRSFLIIEKIENQD